MSATRTKAQLPLTKEDHDAVLAKARAEIKRVKTQPLSPLDQVFSTFKTWEQRKFENANNIIQTVDGLDKLQVEAPPAEFITTRRTKRQRLSFGSRQQQQSTQRKRNSIQEQEINAMLNQFVSLGPQPNSQQLTQFASIGEAYKYYKSQQDEQQKLQIEFDLMKQRVLDFQTNHQSIGLQQSPSLSTHSNNNNNDFDSEQDEDYEDNDLVASNTLTFDEIKKNQPITTPRGTKITSFQQLEKLQQSQKQSSQSVIKSSSKLNPTTSTPTKKKLAPQTEDSPQQQIVSKKTQIPSLSGPIGVQKSTLLTPNSKASLIKKTTIATPNAKPMVGSTARLGAPGSVIKATGIGTKVGGITTAAATKSTTTTMTTKTQHQQPAILKQQQQQSTTTLSHQTASQSTLAKNGNIDSESDDMFEDVQELAPVTAGGIRSHDLSVDSLHLDTADLDSFHHDMQRRIVVAANKEAKRISNGQQQHHNKNKVLRKLSTLSSDDDNGDARRPAASSGAQKRIAQHQLQRKSAEEYDNDDGDNDDGVDVQFIQSSDLSYQSSISQDSDSSYMDDDDDDADNDGSSDYSSEMDDDDFDTPTKPKKKKLGAKTPQNDLKLTSSASKKLKAISSSATKKSPSSATKMAVKVKANRAVNNSATKKNPKFAYHDDFSNSDMDDEIDNNNNNKNNNNGLMVDEEDMEQLDGMAMSPTNSQRGMSDVNNAEGAFHDFLGQRISPPLQNLSNLKLGPNMVQPSTTAALHPSLASPSRTASARAFGKQALNVINQQQVQGQGAGGASVPSTSSTTKSPTHKLSGFSSTAKSTASQLAKQQQQLTQQQLRDQQLEKQKLLKQKEQFDHEIRESKRLQNVFRHAAKQGITPSTAYTPKVPMTPVLNDKLSRAKEISRSVAAQTPRFAKDPIAVIQEPPGSDVEHEDLIPDHFIPKWAEQSNVCAMQEKQSLVDADAIFIQPRANWCKLEQMFQTTIYHPDVIAKYGGPRRKQRQRGSSAYWGLDRLQDEEIRQCNKKLGIYTDNY